MDHPAMAAQERTPPEALEGVIHQEGVAVAVVEVTVTQLYLQVSFSEKLGLLGLSYEYTLQTFDHSLHISQLLLKQK